MTGFVARPNRRTALKTTLGTAALAGIFRPLFAAPGSRWFKIGACEWSLRKPGPAVFDVAKEIGLDGIQADLGNPENAASLIHPANQKAYLEASTRTGIEIASLALGIMNSVPLKADPRAAKWLLDSVAVAKAIGSRIIMPACFGRGDLDMNRTDEIDQFVKAVKAAVPLAEKEGLIIALENYLSAEDNMRLIDRIGSPVVKVYYDVGNSTDKGRDVTKEIRTLGKLICEFHAKDGKHLLGQGRIDFKAVRAAIDDIGYNGWIHLECAAPKGIVPDYTDQAKFLRTVFPEKKS